MFSFERKIKRGAVCASLEWQVGGPFIANISNDSELVRNQPFHGQQHIQADVLE